LTEALAALAASNARLKERDDSLELTVARQARNIAQERKDFQATVVQQQQQIQALTANLKEQASLLQKVSAQMQVNRPAPQVVSN